MRTLFAVMVLVAACHKPTEPKDRCVAGNYSICMCADMSKGTHQCKEDGKSFTECSCDGVSEQPQTSTTPPKQDPPSSVDNDSDICPGKLVAIEPNQTSVESGETNAAVANYKGHNMCGEAATAKERVYEIIPTAGGRLTVNMQGKGALDGVLYVRSDRCRDGDQVVCGDSTRAAGLETVSLNVRAGSKYYVFADGRGSTVGGYDLTFDLEAGGFCGDGNVDFGEACDDANAVPEDGCSDTCTPQGNPLAYALCPGMPIHLWGGDNLVFGGSTTPYGASYRDENDVCVPSGSTSKDRVYAITAHASGTMTIDQQGDYNGMLYIRTGSCSGATVACANNNGPSQGTEAFHETLTMPVTAGETYWLFVDGGSTVVAGNYTLSITL